MKSDGEKMYDRAIDFSNAARIIEMHSKPSSLQIPVQVLRGFAMELIIKSIYFKTHGRKWEKIHDFSKLFDKLEQRHKAWIEDKFNNQVKTKGDDTLEKLLKEKGMTVPVGLMENLIKWSYVFEGLRYPDCEKRGFTMLYYDQIMKSLIAFYESGINELHDDKLN